MSAPTPSGEPPAPAHRFPADPSLAARLVAIRRDLHRHPELSWREERTATVVLERLRALGLEPVRLGGTGVIADIPGPEGAPTIALRADLDALPIQEETGLEFASENPGVMHACGHDGHTAMVLGAAELLTSLPELPAPVRLLFQPAEETGAGAPHMVQAGALEGVSLIFGAHLDWIFEAGTLIVGEGPFNASTDRFEIHLRAPGAHAARPHESPDPVVVGSHLVLALQTIVSRQIDPAFPAVVTVGRFHAGTVNNAIASEARLAGTLRAQTPEVRQKLREAVDRTARSIAELHGLEVHFVLDRGTPPLINAPGPAALALSGALATVGESHIRPMPKANMGGEDFAHYLEVDGLEGGYIRIGARPADREFHPAHSGRFDFDEAALEIGARWFAHTALAAGESLRR